MARRRWHPFNTDQCSCHSPPVLRQDVCLASSFSLEHTPAHTAKKGAGGLLLPLSRSPECRDPPSTIALTFNVENSPRTALRARTTFEICTRGPRLCAQCVSSAPILLASHQTFCENAHWWPVTSHQVPLFALSGGSWAAKSKATKPPTRPMIKRTRTWSQPNHPPAVLDNFGRWAARPGRPNAKALVDHATILRASEVSPSPPIPVRQPLTRFAYPSKAGRSSHARGN